jgi:hypothetical protein
MRSQLPDPAGPGRHASEDLLVAYAAGAVVGVAAWSVEAHLTGCAQCRHAVSAHVDAERLVRNRSVLLVRAALPDAGLLIRLLGRVGVPEYLLRLLAATPSLRRSWLLAVAVVLAAVTGESVLVAHLWNGPFGHEAAGAWVLVPFLLVAPLVVLASVAAAFMPLFDPAYQLTLAAPFSAFALLLVRALSALIAALVPLVVAAFLVPGPEWLPAALLLPSLALCAFALATATVIGPQAAATASAALWVVAVILLAVPDAAALVVVQWHVQAVCSVVVIAAMAVLWLRRDRFELGWTR